MAGLRTVSTFEGKTFVILNPVAIAELMKSPVGIVMRHMIVVGEKVKQEAIHIAPKRTGNMAKHIVKRIATVGTQPNVLVGVENVPYAIYVHEGTRRHWIYPRNAKVLAWPGTPTAGMSFDVANFGNMIFATKVDHPGNKPNRFLVRALRTVVPTS